MAGVISLHDQFRQQLDVDKVNVDAELKNQNFLNAGQDWLVKNSVSWAEMDARTMPSRYALQTVEC